MVTLADGFVLHGFVERVGDPVPLVAPDGTPHQADRLLVEALAAMVHVTGGQPSSEVAIAVPAYWGMATLRSLRTALRADPNLAPGGMPARLVSDAVASLTALQTNPGLPSQGVIALLDFGGSGTSITLADAGASFEPIDETARYTDFAGDQIDQALLSHIVDGIAAAGGIDPAATAAVGSLSRLRGECRNAKERLSAQSSTEVIAELPGYRSTIQLTRNELESLIEAPLGGLLVVLENTLERNGIAWTNVAAVVTVGGGASIPLIAQRLSEHTSTPVVTTSQPALDAAVGAALFAAYGSAAEAQTGLAPAVAEAATGAAPAAVDAPTPETVSALAWSQDDDVADEPVPYTGENPYDAEAISMRQPVQYLPATGPIEEPRAWQRLPQLVFGLAAAVALDRRRWSGDRVDECEQQHQPNGAAQHREPGETAECRTTPAERRTAGVGRAARGNRDRHQRGAASSAHHPRARHDIRDHHTSDDDHDAADDHNDDHNHDDHHHDDDHNDNVADHDHDDNHHTHDDDELHHGAVRPGADTGSGAEQSEQSVPAAARALTASADTGTPVRGTG